MRPRHVRARLRQGDAIGYGRFVPQSQIAHAACQCLEEREHQGVHKAALSLLLERPFKRQLQGHPGSKEAASLRPGSRNSVGSHGRPAIEKRIQRNLLHLGRAAAGGVRGHGGIL